METSLENAIIISIVGFSVVLICLIFFAMMISAINKLDNILKNRKSKKTDISKEEVASTIVIQEDFDKDVVPVIIAAVYSMFSEKIIIKKINFLNKRSSEDTDWARLSRASAVSTHNIRRRGS